MAHKLACLRVRSVTVIDGDGGSTADPLVPCPVRGATALATCEQCMRMEVITADLKGRADAVICRPAVALWERLTQPLRPLSETPLYNMISRNLTCVTCDASLRQVAELMGERCVEAVPVVDYDHGAVGMVARADLLRGGEHVPEIMQRSVTLEQHETLARAAELMLIEGVKHLLVVDREERVVGLLAASDVARTLVRGQRIERPEEPDTEPMGVQAPEVTGRA